MRLLLFLTAFIVTFSSCNRKIKPKSPFENISKVDTTCLIEIGEAKEDIQIGKLIYCHFAGSLLYEPLRNAHEMDSILHKYGIDYKEEITSDVIIENQTKGCYCNFMKEQIDAKFGKTFIDSLLNISDSFYVLNNLSDTFYYANCDTRPNYPTDTNTNPDEYSEVFQNDLEKSVRYPAAYIKKTNNDSSAFVDVHLYVDKAGNASITGYRFIFDMKTNHKYEKKFAIEIDKAMRKRNWTPATIRNQKVNANMVMRLYFD
jgi:hypothetical protein